MIINYAGKTDDNGVTGTVSVSSPTFVDHIRDLRPVFKFIAVLAVLILI